MASTRLGQDASGYCGPPHVVVHTAQRAQASQAQAVYVATDDEQIYEALLANMASSLNDRQQPSIWHRSLGRGGAAIGSPALACIIINVQGDEPLN